MAKPIDYTGDPVHSAATVAENAAGGAVLGAFTPLLVGASLIGAVGLGLAFAPVATLVALGIGIPATIATAPIWGTAAGIGAVLGAGKGVHQVRSEQRAFDAKVQGLQQAPSPEMQEQIFNAGVQEGANQVLDRLQQVHSELIAQEQAQVQAAQANQPSPEVSAPPAPPAIEPQQVHHHHFVHAEADVAAVHAANEEGDKAQSFTAFAANVRPKSIRPEDIERRKFTPQDIIEQRQAVTDPNFAQQQRA